MKIGVDLGGTNMRVGLADGATILRREVADCPAQAAEEEVTGLLVRLIRKVMDSSVTGIGIGVPSVVDAVRGIVYNVNNIPSWREVHLKERLEQEFGVTVSVNNDSNCFTLGVKVFGEGRNYDNLVGITMGTGIGSGLIIGGQLYNGRNTGAGEIGSLPYLEHDFEHYCSSGFFTRYHGSTGRELGQRAQQGDTEALRVWEEFGVHVGELMKAALFAYDPEAIIIGGGIAAAFPFFEKPMRQQLATFPYPETVRNVHILTSTLPDAALLGASALGC